MRLANLVPTSRRCLTEGYISLGWAIPRHQPLKHIVAWQQVNQCRNDLQTSSLWYQLMSHYTDNLCARVHIIGPPSHWSPISLIPHLIGPPSHWSPKWHPCTTRFIGPPSHWSPRLIGPPSHWSPFKSLVTPSSANPNGPPSTLFELIGPPSHWSPFISPPILGQSQWFPHLTGPPSHWSPISLVPQLAPMHHPFHWSPISLVPHPIGPFSPAGPPIHKSPPHCLNSHCPPPLVTLSTLFSSVPHLIGPPV